MRLSLEGEDRLDTKSKVDCSDGAIPVFDGARILQHHNPGPLRPTNSQGCKTMFYCFKHVSQPEGRFERGRAGASGQRARAERASIKSKQKEKEKGKGQPWDRRVKKKEVEVLYYFEKYCA